MGHFVQEWLYDIVEESLKQKGFDGLCNPELECGCFIGDLAPCDNPNFKQCKGGIRETTPDGDICVLKWIDT